MMLRRESPVNMVNVIPKCEQVKELLRKEIAEGKFAPGDKIPIEPELSRIYNVGRSSVREAVSSLVHEGLLIKRQGLGTFVQTDSQASSRNRRSGRIGLTFDLRPHTLEGIRFCQDLAMDKGGILTVYNVGKDYQDPVKERKFLELAQKEGFIGVALYPTPLEPSNTPLYRELRQKGMKIALLVPYAQNGDDHVTFFHDYARAGYLAVAKMAAAGYKHVCLVKLVNRLPLAFRMLRDGLEQAAADLSLKIEREIAVDQSVEYASQTAAVASEAFDAIKHLPRKTGMLVTQNQACLSVKRLSALSHRRFPGDLALCVCSEYEHPELSDVSILRFQAQALLTEAIDYLLDESIAPMSAVHKTFPAVFVDKGSV